MQKKLLNTNIIDDDGGKKKDKSLPGLVSVHGWEGLDISELFSEKTVLTISSPGHFIQFWNITEYKIKYFLKAIILTGI